MEDAPNLQLCAEMLRQFADFLDGATVARGGLFSSRAVLVQAEALAELDKKGRNDE